MVAHGIRSKVLASLVCLAGIMLLCPASVQSQQNRPPVLNHIGNQTISAGDVIAFCISAEDPDGNEIEYSVWQAGDFDHSGAVVALDVLTIINAVNNSGGTIFPGDELWNPEMDLSNDGYISALDVLMVINIVNDTDRKIPDGKIDPKNGYFSWTPNSDYIDNNNLLTFVASDGELCDAEIVRITVTERPGAAPAVSDAELLDETEARSAHYFYREALPNGLVKDASHTDYASIAATGFGLAALTVIAERYGTSSHWFIPPELARRRAERILDTCLRIQDAQAADPDNYGTAGFLYHFIDADGKRQGACEVSTVDTAIFAAGAITAGEYFAGEVKSKADQFYNNIDWSYFLIPSKKQFSHGWKPEYGLLAATWDRPTDETLLVSLLAIASDPDNTDFLETMFSWPRLMRSYAGYDVVNSYFGSLFTYYFAHIFFDFEKMGDDNPYVINSNTPPVDWWQNSVRAVSANRQFCIDQSRNYASYGPDSWGITPCQSYTGEYLGLLGAKPCEYGSGNPVHDGTIAPSGAISSLPLMRTSPGETLNDNPAFKALKHYYNTYYAQLWGEYGPRDSFNQQGLCSPNYVGINVGSQVLMIENYRSGLLWNNFMKNAKIQSVVDKVFKDRSVFLIPDTWKLGTIRQGASIINEKIIVTNDSDTPVTYSLSIEDAAGTLAGWQPADTPGINKYAASAVFTGTDVEFVDASNFGPEDMLYENPQKSDTARFAAAVSSKNGLNVPPREKRALWIKFNAPRADTTNRTKHEEHFIYVKVKAE